MATTSNGWPYVIPSDHPKEYPAASQAAANLANTAPRIAASAAARDAAIPAPVEGMRCYRTDLNIGEVYSGTAWRRDTAAFLDLAGARVGIGLWGPNTITTDAAANSQVLDLSAGGMFVGSVIWVHGARPGNSPIQLSIATGPVTGAQFACRDHAGNPFTSVSIPSVGIAYMAALAY